MNCDFESNMKLVPYVYNMCFTKCKEYKEDLMQEGYIGLLKAIDKYTDKLDTSFSTFAFFCIRNQMGMFMRKERKHASNVISDVVDNGGQEDSLFDYLVDELEEERKEEKMMCDMLLEKMPDKEIVESWINGATQSEISKSKKLSQPAIARIIKKNLCNIKQEFEYNK